MPSENRPAPAVGQVWRSGQGNLFVIADNVRDGMFMLVFERIAHAGGRWTHGSIHPTDTYVGQFRGFKVEGME